MAAALLLCLCAAECAVGGGEGEGLHVVARLNAPWPAGLGRVSPSASRAVRSAERWGASLWSGVVRGRAGEGELSDSLPAEGRRLPLVWGGMERHSSLHQVDEIGSVEVTLPLSEWQALSRLAGVNATLISRDATAHYASRAAASMNASLNAGEGSTHPSASRRTLMQSAQGEAWWQAARWAHAAVFGARRQLAAGSMGGFLTLEEAYAEMDRLQRQHPTRLSTPIRLGTTRQGRPLQAWCLTEGLVGCDIEKPAPDGRPTVLYTALVHAREPQTLMCLLKFVETV